MIKRKYKYILFIVILVILYVIVNFFRSYHWIQIKEYIIKDSKIESNIKLVIIGDLHDYVFSKDNDELVQKIISEQADIILIVGDMLNSNSENAEVILQLIKDILPMAPVYYALGNHELEWQETHAYDLKAQLEKAGAQIVEKNWFDIEINGASIRIGGLYEYAYDKESILTFGITGKKLEVYNYLTEYQETNSYKIMLSHRPEAFVCSNAMRSYDIDLVVSGHLHGGQVVLPFWGGIFATEQGWFPEYVHGLYEIDDTNILITSGLSTNKKVVPRWNNPPEIMVLELCPAK